MIRALLLICAVATPAFADDPSPELARLQRSVHAASEQARSSRHSVVVTGVVAGAILVPTGLVIERRGDDLSSSIGLGMVFGGGIPMAFSALSLSASPMEDLEAQLEARRTSMTESEAVRLTVDDWRELAAKSRVRRHRVGAIELGLGIVATAVGIAFLRDNQVGDLSRNSQYTIGSVLAGAGIPILQLGVRSFVQRSPQEVWWDAYAQ